MEWCLSNHFSDEVRQKALPRMNVESGEAASGKHARPGATPLLDDFLMFARQRQQGSQELVREHPSLQILGILLAT
jgi:hypothetical protein